MNHVKTQDLARMAWNASLYSNVHSAARGRTLWIIGSHGLRVVASDDYFILVDETETSSNAYAQYLSVDLKNLKALEKALRSSDNELFDLEGLPGEPLDVESLQEDVLYASDDLVRESDQAYLMFEDHRIAVAADRLRNLARIKPGGDHPIDLKLFTGGDKSEALVAFRMGPTVRGVIAPLDREELEKQYTGNEIWR